MKLKILVGTVTSTADYVAQAIQMDCADLVEQVEVLLMDGLRIDAFEPDAVAAELTCDATAERTWAVIDSVLAMPPHCRHAEEGGIASRVAGAPQPIAAGAKLAHFGNRLRSLVVRRLHG